MVRAHGDSPEQAAYLQSLTFIAPVEFLLSPSVTCSLTGPGE